MLNANKTAFPAAVAADVGRQGEAADGRRSTAQAGTKVNGGMAALVLPAVFDFFDRTHRK